MSSTSEIDELARSLKESRKKWKDGVDIQDKNAVYEYMDHKLTEYEHDGFTDQDMWEQFRDDFTGFTEEHFKVGGPTMLRKLRNLLCKQGVWILRSTRVTIAKSLQNTIQEETPTEWTQEEVAAHFKSFGAFNSIQLNSSVGLQSLLPVQLSQPVQALQQPVRQPSVPEQPNRPVQPNLHAQPTRLVQPDHPQNSLNAEDLPTQPQHKGYTKELGSLHKLYTESVKYSGEKDNFDYKLTIFRDLCERAEVPTYALRLAYPTMLKEPALSHYYTNLRNNKDVVSFDDMCTATCQYFEGFEYKIGILKEWETTSLATVINQNPGKPTSECLRLLITELRRLQHGLDSELRTDKHMYAKLLTACKDTKACRIAVSKPANTISGLVSDLQSSVSAYESSKALKESTFTTENNKSNPEMHFTDRRYQQNQSHGAHYRHKHGNHSNRHGKKCFVCKEVGYWSSKHTQEERDASRKQFESRFQKNFQKKFR